MSTVERETIIRRVSKLLALSSDNPSEAEAQAAAVKAQEMMLGEAITMADIAAWEVENGTRTVKLEAGHIEYHCDTGTANRRAAPSWDPWRGYRSGRLIQGTPTWRAELAWAVAKAMGARCIWTPTQGKKSDGSFELGKLTFIGFNVETILEVYRYLELQLDSLSVTEMRDRPAIEKYNRETGEYDLVKPNGRYWRLSWLKGATERVREILLEQYAKVEATNGKELVLVRDLVNEKVQELFPNTTNARRRTKVYDGNAYRRGRVAAENVDIGRSKLGSPAKQLAS